MVRKIISFDTDDEAHWRALLECGHHQHVRHRPPLESREWVLDPAERDRKSTRLNSSHRCISYAVFCLKKKKRTHRLSYETRRRSCADRRLTPYDRRSGL